MPAPTGCIDKEEMVGVRGFEPPTPASRTQYSTGLSYTPTVDKLYKKLREPRAVSVTIAWSPDPKLFTGKFTTPLLIQERQDCSRDSLLRNPPVLLHGRVQAELTGVKFLTRSDCTKVIEDLEHFGASPSIIPPTEVTA